MDVVAALAPRGNILFLIYTTTSTGIGTLFALSPPTTNGGSAGGSAGDNNSNSMEALTHTIDSSSSVTVPPGIHSASMISTATFDTTSGANRYQLFLALSTDSQPRLYLLEPESPNVGDGQEVNMRSFASPKWNITDESQSLNIAQGISGVWLASGRVNRTSSSTGAAATAAAPSEGSAMFKMLSYENSTIIQKLDVSEQVLGMPLMPTWPIRVNYLNNDKDSKIVQLTDDNSGKDFEVFLIGACQTVPETCILFMNGNGDTVPITMSGTYDPTSCVAAASGSVIMATPSGVLMFPYANITRTMTTISAANATNASKTQMWTKYSSTFVLPSPILTCSIMNSKLYAVTRGNDTKMPSIYSIDLTNTKQRVWQSIQLEPAKPKNDSGRMSGGAIAAVVVSLILILLVGIFLFVWRRKRGQKRTSEPDREEKLLWTPLTTGMNTVDNGLWRPPTKESYGVESEIGLWRPTTIESEGESGLWRPTTIESDRMEGEDGLWRPTTLESDHGEYESLWRPTSLESDNVSRISRGSGRNPQGPATRAGDLEGPVTAGVDLKTTSRVPQGLA